MNRFSSIGIILVIFLFCVSLNGKIETLTWDSFSDNSENCHDYDSGVVSDGKLVIHEQHIETVNDSIHFIVTCDLYTTINIFKEATNNSNKVLTSYIQTLCEIGANADGADGCNAEFVLDPSPASDIFESILLINDYQLNLTLEAISKGQANLFDSSRSQGINTFYILYKSEH